MGAVHAPAVVLATGGMGQVFSATTNPSVSTGDGVALALRAGAEVSDLEFVQFHPTVLFLGAGRRGPAAAGLRGGTRRGRPPGRRATACASWSGQHELAELAPRDIVAKGIMRRMQEQGAEHMFLDARHFGAEMWEHRFPTILAACRAHGIDPVDRARPGRPGRALRLRRRPHRPAGPHHGPRPVRVRRGRLHRRARRQPARLQLPPGRPGLRRAHRRRHRGESRRGRPPRARARTRAAPRDARAPAARPRGPVRDPADHDRGRRRAALRRLPRDRRRPAPAAAHRRAATPSTRTARPPSPASTPGRRPTCCAWPVSWSPPPACARRPAAATGARTTPTGTTTRLAPPHRRTAESRTGRSPYAPPIPRDFPRLRQPHPAPQSRPQEQ